jgi:hypothetical protein
VAFTELVGSLKLRTRAGDPNSAHYTTLLPRHNLHNRASKIHRAAQCQICCSTSCEGRSVLKRQVCCCVQRVFKFEVKYKCVNMWDRSVGQGRAKVGVV